MVQKQIYDVTNEKYVTIEVNDREDPSTLPNLLVNKKTERNALLQETDWTLCPDSPLTDAQKTEVTEYREKLRNFPATADFPNGAFPTKPDFI
tara:strand:- start:3248 stop:3526 length:279 start_codon:yes stop_codon:yes gene_type:complete